VPLHLHVLLESGSTLLARWWLAPLPESVA